MSDERSQEEEDLFNCALMTDRLTCLGSFSAVACGGIKTGEGRNR